MLKGLHNYGRPARLVHSAGGQARAKEKQLSNVCREDGDTFLSVAKADEERGQTQNDIDLMRILRGEQVG